MEKKVFKKQQQQLSHYLVIEILNYYILNISKETKPFELFGYFKHDYFRKIYQLFRSLKLNKIKNEIYFNSNKIIFLFINKSYKQINVSSWSNLKTLISKSKFEIDSHFIKDNIFNIKYFPKLKHLKIKDIRQEPLQQTKLNIYPEVLTINNNFNLDKNYFCKKEANQFKKLCLFGIKIYNIFKWTQLENLVCLFIFEVQSNEIDLLFQTQIFTNLLTLCLQNTFCTGDGWIGCKNIINLNLHEKNFNSKNIKQFPNLQRLSFISNKIDDETTFPKSLKKFTTRNDVSLKILNKIKNIKNLTLIFCNHPINQWPIFKNLVLLYIARSELEITNKKFPILKRLKLIDYNFISIRDYSFNELSSLDISRGLNVNDIFKFKKFDNLERLLISNCNDLNLKDWKEFPKLTILSIKYDLRTSIIYNILYIFDRYRFKKLKILWMDFNPRSAQDFKKLKIDKRNFFNLKSFVTSGFEETTNKIQNIFGIITSK